MVTAHLPPSVTLRPAQAGDEPVLYAIHRAAMREVVTQAYGAWDEEFQRRYLHEHMGDRPIEIVCEEGRPVGLLSVIEREDELVLASIELAPEAQNRGIGGVLVRSVLERGRAAGKPVALRDLKANRAVALYTRLGFRVVADDAGYCYLRSEVAPASP